MIVSDITTLECDAIVNAANVALERGGGVCGEIFRVAGPRLDEACRVLAPCPTGRARITPGYDAKARWIVHAVGPIWRGGNDGEPKQLASAYTEALHLAGEAGANSIAFPAISTGTYGYPREDAAKVAVNAVRAWCERKAAPAHIIFCCFSEADAAAYRPLLDDH